MSYGFGIVGLGMIADFHAQAIQATEKGELVAGFEVVQDKADRFADKYGCKCYSSLSAFLEHPGLDIINICTPSGTHLESALAGAKAGKHLVIEKPLEITLDRCDRIIEACRKNNVLCAGIFPSRFLESSGMVKAAIDSGRFGKLIMGDAYVKWYRSQEYYDTGGWKGTYKYDGGGALMNQSIHAIDLLGWFMGPVYSVQAFTGTLGHTGIEVEDTAVAALRFKNGAMGVIEGTTAIYPGFQKKIEICGTEGSAVLVEESLQEWLFAKETAEDELLRKRLSETSKKIGNAADPADISFKGHQKQLEDLMEALETGGKPAVDGTEARKAVEIILAVYKSSRKGRPVFL